MTPDRFSPRGRRILLTALLAVLAVGRPGLDAEAPQQPDLQATTKALTDAANHGNFDEAVRQG